MPGKEVECLALAPRVITEVFLQFKRDEAMKYTEMLGQMLWHVLGPPPGVAIASIVDLTEISQRKLCRAQGPAGQKFSKRCRALLC